MKKTLIILTAFISAVMISCKDANKELLVKEKFEKKVDGKQVSLYTLQNKNGVVCQITNYGARVVALSVPNKDKKITDVVLGHESIDQYLKNGEYLGAIVGRYGNRIANGQFSLNGKNYTLFKNNGPNTLHGGKKGYANVVWDARPFTTQNGENAVEMSYLSKDGEEGFPGNLNIKVTYTLTETNGLKIEYWAQTDAETVVNLTNHAYFNLKGAGNGDIFSHNLTIYADNFTPTDSTLIPTGKIQNVANTPMDFRTAHTIGERINEKTIDLKYGKGYDHNWILNKTGKEFTLASIVAEPSTGIEMRVFTTEPALQFYSGNFLDGKIIGKDKKQYNYRNAFCMEAQHYPDAPNHANFPSTTLKPGETYKQTTLYQFLLMK
ncbi:aldose epimerase family protein [Flavobacterium phragmitis]|uniref:Aldose 1-epimerase n=1 Tax=Flavobacterium phragmitis TaxID=739143 RepID=A0A1I1L7M5_9FLAO|nr:aldose epimerase family protein [Flavobacterium phragmitis]SFC65540.1 aldose 1-epimerase [Flavobacterium phragmitis]